MEFTFRYIFAGFSFPNKSVVETLIETVIIPHAEMLFWKFKGCKITMNLSGYKWILE